ncbi:unnamed protein product [Cuscuta campestris]|uniref:DUF1639 domain-containing protein n=1 Tax=Cuscuta campestris TaxID=132261 RepID=A0A484LQF3_9ASTE|nr:unnamed protein product [Cuscuta campestris]
MAMGTHRSKPPPLQQPLHNFTLPCGLEWGKRKFSNEEIAAVHRRSNGRSSSEKLLGTRRSEAAIGRQSLGSDWRDPRTGVLQNRLTEGGRKFRSEVEDGIAAVREKLLFDLQAAATKMKDAIFMMGLGENEEPPLAADKGEGEPPAPAICRNTNPPAGPSETALPWNLRARRSSSKQFTGTAASGESNPGSKSDVRPPPRPNGSPMKTENRSPRIPSGSAAGQKRGRAKFSVALTRQEIEEDFAAITGNKPARRPKKRSKTVQKNLDSLFPGLWLAEISADMYKVPDDQ